MKINIVNSETTSFSDSVGVSDERMEQLLKAAFATMKDRKSKQESAAIIAEACESLEEFAVVWGFHCVFMGEHKVW